MGTEGIWVPALWTALATSAAGAGATAINNRNIAKEREQIANRGIAAQSLRQREAEARISEEIGAQARSSPEQEQRESLDEFTSALASAKTQAAGDTAVPMGSDSYQTDETASKAAIQNYGAQQADIQSRIMAPLRQRVREGVSRGRAGADVAGIARNADAEDFLNRMLQQSVRGNTALELGGAIATGAGQAMAGSAGSIPSSGEISSGVARSQADVARQLRSRRYTPADFGL